MKNKFLKVACIVFAGLSLASCQKGEELPAKGSIKQNDIVFSPKSVVGYVGDPMPFYDDGKMNIFYLQDGRNTNLGFHPFALMTTTDFMHYEDHGEVIPYSNVLDSPDFALGTGSVIKDKDGLYHCYYTGHNSGKTTGLPFYEKIQHATSTDKLNWTKHPEDGFYGNDNDFRDPYVYLGEDNTYHMLITTRNAGSGVIKEYTSSNLKSWSYKGIFFKNDSGSYNMECPTFIKYNDYYYLSYSEQGSTRVTRYRYKKNLSDSWSKPANDFLDGIGFYAGRMEKDDKNLYMFGWCGTRVGEYDQGNIDWGGNLVVHKLLQKENGELNATIVDSVKETLKNEVSYKLKNGKSLSSMEFDKNSFKAYTVENLSKNITRISFDLEINELKGSLGLSFATYTDNMLSNEVIMLNLETKLALTYANATSEKSLGKIDAYVPIDYKKGIMHIDVVIDKQIVSMYIDNQKALTTRFYDMPENVFSFFSNKADANFKNIKFFE